MPATLSAPINVQVTEIRILQLSLNAEAGTVSYSYQQGTELKQATDTAQNWLNAMQASTGSFKNRVYQVLLGMIGLSGTVS